MEGEKNWIEIAVHLSFSAGGGSASGMTGEVGRYTRSNLIYQLKAAGRGS